MTAPAVSLIPCTVRDPHGYRDHPEWDTIGKVIIDLAAQVDAPPFELVIVDGLHHSRGLAQQRDVGNVPFPCIHIPPRETVWTRLHKVAISAFRNTGIAAASGELIINLDDCCIIPPNFVATFWRAWLRHRTALALTWPQRGDQRVPGPVVRPGGVYGFCSFPRELALEVNGYDECYDGGQGLEDADMSTRLFHAGLQQALIQLPGFDIEAQTSHSPDAIDPQRSIVKCCNLAWNTQRVWRNIQVANLAKDWTPEALRRLVGPCILLHKESGMCEHHLWHQKCAYLEQGFATELDSEAALVFNEPPVVNLRKLSEAMR